ncbi:hypothetical protein BGX26_010962 [Mortierella sp. AD094]|nr:hypothetical protein BGX26_010962 [Mortierella sp. AD094]
MKTQFYISAISSAPKLRHSDADQIGHDYINLGEQYRNNGDIEKAAEQYELAADYCPKKASNRLQELPLFDSPSENSSSDRHSTERERSRVARANENRDQILEHPLKV